MAFANDRKKVDLRRLEKPSTINLSKAIQFIPTFIHIPPEISWPG